MYKKEFKYADLIGVPFKNLGRDVQTGLDCYGLVHEVFRRAGMEIGEYYEKMLLLAVVALFFIHGDPWSWIIGILACLAVYFIEILIDNVSARVNWRKLLDICWLITLLCGGINVLILMLI